MLGVIYTRSSRTWSGFKEKKEKEKEKLFLILILILKYVWYIKRKKVISYTVQFKWWVVITGRVYLTQTRRVPGFWRWTNARSSRFPQRALLQSSCSSRRRLR